MGKVKWSFSLIFAIFLVGILSTAAFAASVVYTLKTVQNGSGLEVSFTGNPDDDGGYNLLIKDGSNSTIQTDPITLNSSNIGTLNISSGLTVGKTYTLQLYKASDNTTLLSKASVVITDGNNTSMPNSNLTGYNNLKKQRSGQQMHGFYQNNTNSCASCHQTHTSKNGDALLFKNGTYDTCTACHDGTTSASQDSISGSFNVSDDVNHGSFHQADGSLQISAAPGGNRTPDTTSGSIGASTWGQDFDCASCHNPHGGGSVNENNLNEDPLGWGKIAYKSAHDGGSGDQQNGKLFTSRDIYSSVPGSFADGNYDTYILVKTTAGDVNSTISKTNNTNNGYLYAQAGITETSTPVIQTYRWDGTGYVADYSLWLRDLRNESAPFAQSNTVLFDRNGTDITTGSGTNITAVWANGFAYGSGVANVTKYSLSVGINVEGSDTDVASYYDSTDPNYIPDSGVEMTKFCVACHTDYLVDPTTGNTGVLASTALNTSYRHPVTDEFTCVRCHYAHGTKSSMMEDKTGTVDATKETLSSLNPYHTSALRRYINDDSCYTTGCHTETSGPLYLDLSD